MKRIMGSMEIHPYPLMKVTRWLILVGALLITIASVDSATAQSTDRKNPTRLTSNEVSGLIGGNLGDSYYYTFIAGPGRIRLTLTIEGGKGMLTYNAIEIEVFNEKVRKIASASVTSISGRSAQRTLPVNFSRRERVLLRINVPEGNQVSAKYRLRLSGAIELAQGTGEANGNVAGVGERSRNESGNCVPKQGTLVIKMKDGSRRIIDLGETESVTIVP
jgi:hypothetical protein